MDTRDIVVEKLQEIARLEDEHKILGVSFAVREGARVTVEESVDYVTKVITRSASLLQNKDDLHNPGLSLPQ